MTEGSRIAVILFNLGGPDKPEAVRPFLFNLFNDPAILGVPALVRPVLAWLISSRRAEKAREIYRHLGGRSPLLDNTKAQARALERALADQGDHSRVYRVFVVMRYWHPRAEEVAKAVQDWNADRVVLMPLYPQWSVTTTGSSFRDWRRACRRIGQDWPTSSVCCYPVEPGFVAALAQSIRERFEVAAAHGRPRVLFSAHGLPRRVIEGGDPYQWQCEQTAAAIAAAVGIPDLDWLNCYQSKVGPLTWIGPDTDAEIIRAGREGVPLVVVPIAFVSEHSETLVELDIDYRDLAARSGVPAYLRVPTVGITPAFIDGLARLIRTTVNKIPVSVPVPEDTNGWRGCSPARTQCGYGTTVSAGRE